MSSVTGASELFLSPQREAASDSNENTPRVFPNTPHAPCKKRSREGWDFAGVEKRVFVFIEPATEGFSLQEEIGMPSDTEMNWKSIHALVHPIFRYSSEAFLYGKIYTIYQKYVLERDREGLVEALQPNAQDHFPAGWEYADIPLIWSFLIISAGFSLAKMQEDLRVLERELAFDVYRPNSKGDTLWFYAARCGLTNVLRMLIEEGIDINKADRCQLTALFLAAREGHEATVSLLLSIFPESLYTRSWHKVHWLLPQEVAIWEKHKTVIDTMARHAKSSSAVFVRKLAPWNNLWCSCDVLQWIQQNIVPIQSNVYQGKFSFCVIDLLDQKDMYENYFESWILKMQYVCQGFFYADRPYSLPADVYTKERQDRFDQYLTTQEKRMELSELYMS